ncbi:MAG: glycosyltransferase [Cyclobacteriaceae bacterium]
MKRVLVAALDWGLGHATRCIPVVRLLRERGATVSLASSGEAGVLLREEFPDLPYYELPAYKPYYGHGPWMMITMAMQLRGFNQSIRAEKKAIDELMDAHHFDVIISDNRYGCWSAKATSVMITHQLRIPFSFPWNWASGISARLLKHLLRPFDHIWIPDLPDGILTRAFMTSTPVRSIGWLSRFQPGEADIKYDVIALVSGPEPSRTEFAQVLKEQLIESGKKCLLVLGQPGKPYREKTGAVTVTNHLPSALLEAAIRSSALVVARSGYSTIMDLIALGKRAVFVPTPGQPEQLHLARVLQRQQVAGAELQEKFDLNKLLKSEQRYAGLSIFVPDHQLLHQAIDDLLK